MLKAMFVGVITAVVISGCGLEIPSGYRPPDSTTPASSLTLITQGQRQSPIEITGKTLDGQKFSSDQLGGIVIVNAWASWCAPCREEWPTFIEVEKNYPQINLLGLNEADKTEAAKAFITDAGGNWVHLSDPDQLLAIKSGVISGNFLPGTIVLDKQHRIAAKFIGVVTQPELNQLLDNLLAE